MSTVTGLPVIAAAGGSFLLQTRTPEEVFTPEDLNEEQRQIAVTAAKFAREEILPNAEAVEAKEPGVLRGLIQKAAELGFTAVDIPEEYDGVGMDKTTSALVTDHISALASFSTAFGAQIGIGTLPLVWYGTEEQKKIYLPRIATAELITAYALSESTSGSDAMNIRTRATLTPDGNHYLLNGEKMWITNGSLADVAVVWARCEDDKVRGFLVEQGAPGFKTWEVHGKWSLRASVTSGLSFSDCEIPEENLLPGVVGLRGPLSCLNQARYGIGWGALGAAMACYDTALRYAKTRKQFANKPIASHQLVQEKLAWMITEIVKGQLLALHVGRLKDQGRADPSHISMLKMNNVGIALETARKSRDILGANGIVDDYCIMRHMNNLESVYTYEGTNDIHKLIIGEKITGIAAFE